MQKLSGVEFYRQNDYSNHMKTNLIYTKVKKYIEEMQFLAEGDTVVAGVSGGADSVCLLCVLMELRRELNFELRVVHVNHKLRFTADRDEAYVEKLCRQWEIPFYSEKVDVIAYGQQEGISTEESGREIRYKVMETALSDVPSHKRKIAVAHNMDDNSETMLLNLFRGSGIKGLSGIPARRGMIIRPLLCLRRWEIEAFLSEKEIDYCIDETNQEDTYTRNRIRHHILPKAIELVNEKAVERMRDTAEIMSRAEDYLLGETKVALEKCLYIKDGQYLLLQKEMEKLHSYLRQRVIMETLTKLAGCAKDISGKHVAETEKLLFMQTGKQIHLPYEITGRKDYEGLLFWKGERKEKIEREDVILQIPGTYELPDGSQLTLRLLLEENGAFFVNFPKEQYTKWFDYDKISSALRLRKRREGDYFVLDDIGNRKKVKNYFIGEKIPERERDRIWLLAEEEHVLWIVGHRISHKGKVSETTKRVLEVRYEKGARDGK